MLVLGQDLKLKAERWATGIFRRWSAMAASIVLVVQVSFNLMHRVL